MIGTKFDANKPRPELIPARALLEIAHVMAFGAVKYGDDNWQLVDRAVSRYTGAALRHIQAWQDGERDDPEHGRHHLASAAASLLFILWFELRTKKPETTMVATLVPDDLREVIRAEVSARLVKHHLTMFVAAVFGTLTAAVIAIAASRLWP